MVRKVYAINERHPPRNHNHFAARPTGIHASPSWQPLPEPQQFPDGTRFAANTAPGNGRNGLKGPLQAPTAALPLPAFYPHQWWLHTSRARGRQPSRANHSVASHKKTTRPEGEPANVPSGHQMAHSKNQTRLCPPTPLPAEKNELEQSEKPAAARDNDAAHQPTRNHQLGHRYTLSARPVFLNGEVLLETAVSPSPARHLSSIA